MYMLYGFFLSTHMYAHMQSLSPALSPTFPTISPILPIPLCLSPSLSVGFSRCLGIECRLNENVISFGRHLECRKLKFISVFLARMRSTSRGRRRRSSGREVAH